jgi:hypothetical protein
VRAEDLRRASTRTHSQVRATDRAAAVDAGVGRPRARGPGRRPDDGRLQGSGQPEHLAEADRLASGPRRRSIPRGRRGRVRPAQGPCLRNRAGRRRDTSPDRPPPLSIHPCASGPRSSSRSRLAICASNSRGRPGDPLDATPAWPLSRHWRRQRPTDRSETRNAAATSRLFVPLSKQATAWSRTRSRAPLSASVKPPPCGYLTSPGRPRPPARYPANSPTSPDQVQCPASATSLSTSCATSTPSPPAPLPWNSGVVEGHVNRIKMLKRQMFGRAGFALLRKRVLLTT